MNRDRELWAVASAVLEQHGDQASFFVATRIGSLALAGDAAGVSSWREIAKRMLALTPPPVGEHEPT